LTYINDNTDNIQSCLNHDLGSVNNWLIPNKLPLNVTKTEFLLTGSGRRLSTLTDSPTSAINGVPTCQVIAAKSLAMLVDDKLNWSSHIDKLTKKIALNRPYFIDRALIQPHFDYFI